jgi:hypothetical protein
MALDSLVYSLIQALHNLGAALALGAPVFWLALAPPPQRARPVLGVLVGVWALQGVTGTAFGLSSWLLYGQLPDLHRIAVAALGIKIACVILGLALSVFLFARRDRAPGLLGWLTLACLAGLALIAAAVLRWNA